MSETKVIKTNVKNSKMLILVIILAVIGVILLLWNGDTNTGIKTSNPNEINTLPPSSPSVNPLPSLEGGMGRRDAPDGWKSRKK